MCGKGKEANPLGHVLQVGQVVIEVYETLQMQGRHARGGQSVTGLIWCATRMVTF
jgi:hypothetical protein